MLHYSRTKTIIDAPGGRTGASSCRAESLVAADARQACRACLQNTIVLGLDLQGGSHILLEVDAQALRSEKLDTLRDQVRTRAPRGTHRLYRPRRCRAGRPGAPARRRPIFRRRDQAPRAAQSDLVLAARQYRPVRSRRRPSTPDGLITLTPTEAGVDARIRSAVDQSIEIVRRRVDELGTTEPSIQRQGADRILVQVPGLQDPQRLKELHRHDGEADLPHGRSSR